MTTYPDCHSLGTSHEGTVFGGGDSPEFWEEANVSGDVGETIDISDLTYLAAFVFGGGPAPVACP